MGNGVSERAFHGSGEQPNNPRVRPEKQGVWSLSLTLAIVAFVGAIVVLTIPYAILSVPLPASVNRLGLNVETTQRLFFGHPWYLLVPATLIALWVGYKAYRWACNNTTS